MLDTIRLRLYGILDTKDTTLDRIKKQNSSKGERDKPVYVSTANNELYRRMVNFRGSNSSMMLVFNRETNSWENKTEEEFMKLENSLKLSQHYQVRQKMRFVEERQEKDINMKIRGKYRLTSSSPNIVYDINENGSFIDFEFSIPKYLYGHNLAEFVPQGGSKLKINDPVNLLSWAGQKKYLFDRLDYLIEKFLNELQQFYKCEETPDRNYLEVRRVDLCYNQYFKSMEEALLVLNEQRKINMKRQRINSNIAKSYDTSISYVGTSGSYFKIYHKGSEYSKTGGDLKKHMEINKDFIERLLEDHPGRHAKNYLQHSKEIWGQFQAKGKGTSFTLNDYEKDHLQQIKDTTNEIYKQMPYKVDFLKAEMDKVLRYEVSLTTKFFSAAYKRYVFRRNEKKCPLHNEYMGTYEKVKNSMDDRSTKEVTITPFMRANYKMYHDWLNRSVKLLVLEPELRKKLSKFETTERYDVHPGNNKYTISRFPYSTTIGRHDVGLFSKAFLDVCVDHFQKLVKYYQVKKIRPYEETLDKIVQYNALVDSKRKTYNSDHHHEIFELIWNKERKVFVKEYKTLPSGKFVKRATEMLTQTQLRNEGLKSVNETLLATFLKTMEDRSMSLDEVFAEMRIPKSKRWRIRKDLEMFGIVSQTMRMERDVEMRTCFTEYYWRLNGLKYRNQFFADPHLHYKQAQYKMK